MQEFIVSCCKSAKKSLTLTNMYGINPVEENGVNNDDKTYVAPDTVYLDMNEKEKKKNEETLAKTLWSETLIEVLVAALRKKSPDDRVVNILKELKQKKLEEDYIEDKIRRELGDLAAVRVKKLFFKVK